MSETPLRRKIHVHYSINLGHRPQFSTSGKNTANVVEVAENAPADSPPENNRGDARRAYRGYEAAWRWWSGNNAASFRCSPPRA